MNKLDLINKVFSDTESISDDGAIKAVESLFSSIFEEAKKGNKVSISKFGVFEIKKGESSGYKFSFKASKSLKEMIN